MKLYVGQRVIVGESEARVIRFNLEPYENEVLVEFEDCKVQGWAHKANVRPMLVVGGVYKTRELEGGWQFAKRPESRELKLRFLPSGSIVTLLEVAEDINFAYYATLDGNYDRWGSASDLVQMSPLEALAAVAE